LVSRARELLTAHRAGGAAADDRYFCHGPISLLVSNTVAERGNLRVAAGSGN
jgi:hypothetical protein